MIEKLKKINYPTSKYFDNKKVAVILTTFERPEFFSQVVEGINKCDELEDVPIFVYMDGGARAKQSEITELVKKIKFKHKYAIRRTVNYGANKNFLWALRDIFEDLKFDYIGFLEEDCVVGKNYFKFCYDSFQKIKKNIDPSIGIFQGHGPCELSIEEKKIKVDEVKIAENCHHWGMFFPRETYFTIKQISKGYFDIIDNMPTNGMASRAIIAKKIEICDIFDSMIDSSSEEIDKSVLERYYHKQKTHCTLGWDGTFDLTLPCAGLKRYNSTVNRMYNVGKYGDCFGEQAYISMGLDKVTLDEVW
jgi:hypothetical protein